jgi:Asp-tRNA(Asn)/Glu-tRNA(Gln) amidotransferase A subunit family amidase
VPAALTRLAQPANFVGLPAISVPFGSHADGAPAAVQLIGRHHRDAQLLAAAEVVAAVSEERA